MSQKYTGKAVRRENSWLAKDTRAGTKLDLSLQEKQGKVRPGRFKYGVLLLSHTTPHLREHLLCSWETPHSPLYLLLLTYYHGWSLVTFKKAMKFIHHKSHHLSHFEVYKSVDLYVEVVQPTLLPLSIKLLRGNPVLKSNTPHLHLL